MNKEYESETSSKADRLTRVMFGHTEPISDNKSHDEESFSEVMDEELVTSDRNERLDNWLFGNRKQFSQETDNDDVETNHLHRVINNINIVELMDNIDTLVTSAKQLKPLYRKVTPFIEQFLKK